MALTLIFGFRYCLRIFSYMDPDPQSSGYGSGSGKSSGTLRIRIHKAAGSRSSLALGPDTALSLNNSHLPIAVLYFVKKIYL
jgi:hypothetical protein